MENYTVVFLFGFVLVAVIIGGSTIKNLNEKKAEKKKQLALEKSARAEKRLKLSKSIKKIQWSSEFVIDESVIDNDHKLLFGLINNFNENIPKFENPGQVMPALASLKTYTQKHFAREERLQKAADYTFHDDHKKEHNDLIVKLDAYIDDVGRATEDNISDIAVEISSFLGDWLTKHVIENDLPMKPYVDRMREQATSMGDLT